MGIIYQIAKKCEKPENAFWNFMNFFFCQCMILYGKHAYQKVRKKFPDKQLLLLPIRNAGDILFHSYFRSYLLDYLQKKEEETLLLCAENTRKACEACGLKEIYLLPMPKISAISMAYHFYGQEQIDMIDAYKWCIFDYENIQKPAVKAKRPNFSGNPEQVAKALEQIHCTAGNTIVLSPYEKTLTVEKLPKPVPEFWTELAEALQKKGFCVCTNCKGDETEPSVPGTKSIFPALGECETLVNLAGGAVVLRSGFADFIRMTTAKTVVLYPSEVFLQKFRLWNQPVLNHYEILYQDMKNQAYRKRLIADIVEKLSHEKIN